MEGEHGPANLVSDTEMQVTKSSCFKTNKVKILMGFLGLVAGIIFGYCLGRWVVPPRKILTTGRADMSDLVAQYGYLAPTEEFVTKTRLWLKTVDEVLRSNNITYWAIGGTHIGALRNHPPGMMRWDDDMDIAIFDKDYDIVLKLVNEKAKELGYGQLGFDFRGMLMQAGSLDIFTFKWMDGPHGKQYYFKANEYKTQWPNSRFSAEEVDPDNLEDCKYWDITLRCPMNGREILEREYGSDTFTKAYLYNHGGHKPTRTELDLTTNLNEHCGLIPAMNRPLSKKLMFKD